MKVRKQAGSEVRIFDVSPEVYEILDMTGFTEFLTVEKRLREISVDGCEVIGRGFYGTVYRIDPETIVKVYSTPDCIPIIQNEQRLAKRAFVKGVPTAISYDIVRVGDSYGSVFELRSCANTLNSSRSFKNEEEAALSEINDKIRLLANVRFLYLLA